MPSLRVGTSTATLVRLAREIKAQRALEREEEAKRQFAEQLIKSQSSEWTAPEIDTSQPPGWFHEPQKAAFLSHSKDIVACAGHQSGKTEAEAHWTLMELQRCAPFIAWMGFGNHIFCGPTLTLLQDQAIPAFRRVFEAKHGLGKYVGGNKPSFKFSKEGLKKLFGWTGIEVLVKFAYASDSSNLESVTACSGTWDEAGQKENKEASLEAFDRRLTVARSTTFGKMKEWIEEDETRLKCFGWWIERYYNREGPDAVFGRRMFGTTPYEWNWFKTKVYDRALKGDEGFELVSFPTWANPRNSKEKCFADKEHMPEWRWVMMYEGRYTKPAGVIYDVYTVVERPFIEPDWQRAAGHDFGKLNNAGVWAVRHPTRTSKTGKPQWIVYSSYHKGNRTVAEHIASYIYGEDPAYQLDELYRRDPMKWRCGRQIDEESGLWAPVTPLAWGGNPTSEDDSRELYTTNGYPILQPPVGGVMEGIDFLYGMLKDEEIVVCSDLNQVIYELDNYSYEIGDDGEADEAKIHRKSKWHRADCLRYLAVGIAFAAGMVRIISPRGGSEDEEKHDIRKLRPPREDDPVVDLGGRRTVSGAIAARNEVLFGSRQQMKT